MCRTAFAAGIGLVVFGEALRANVGQGVAVVAAAGLFAAWRTLRAEGG